jgi:hypothetical protein
LKSILCLAFMLCSATADFSGWSSCMCLMCSLHLASMDLPVWLMYTFPHSQGIRYTPGISGLSHLWQSWAIAYFSLLAREQSWYYILLRVCWFYWTWPVGMVVQLCLPVYYSSVQASVWGVEQCTGKQAARNRHPSKFRSGIAVHQNPPRRHYTTTHIEIQQADSRSLQTRPDNHILPLWWILLRSEGRTNGHKYSNQEAN